MQINPGFLRFYRRERLQLQCRLITPLFLGNAQQEAQWRAAPFKALLRYWWRVSRPQLAGHQKLLAEESDLFGAAGEAGEKKSLVEVQVKSNSQPERQNLGINIPKIKHPEVQKDMNPLLYLAGMGLMRPDGQVTRSYLPPDADFTLTLTFPHECWEKLRPVLALIQAFGALGARCRNGWGSFRIESGLDLSKEEVVELLINCTRPWKDGFDKDYPHCLGTDATENTVRPLLWRTEAQDSWKTAMRELAEAYISVRAGNPVKNIPKLEPQPNFAERHLLGVPLTRHEVKEIERHASPLRFVIRPGENNTFVGFVLHVPHRFAEAPPPFETHTQIEVWVKVHQNLDRVLTRAATYGESL